MSATGSDSIPRGQHPNSLANLKSPWQPGQEGGGAAKGGAQAAKYRRAIANAVTEQDAIDVIVAMKEAAVGVEVLTHDKKTGEARVYIKPPDTAAARLFFEVLRVIGGEAAQVDLSTAPPEVLDWLEANGKGS